MREGETLFIMFHGYCTMCTNRCTCCTSATFGFIVHNNHFLFRILSMCVLIQARSSFSNEKKYTKTTPIQTEQNSVNMKRYGIWMFVAMIYAAKNVPTIGKMECTHTLFIYIYIQEVQQNASCKGSE